MSEHVSVELRRLVTERAGNRCEYCGLAQEGQEATFHVDHISPIKQGGQTVAENLALACVSCSLRKSARETAVDPESGIEVALFHPRRDVWGDHFEWNEEVVVGKTPSGRATVEALRMNRILILAIRREEALRGRHPPPRPGPVGITR